jgi:hypothetical protein
VEWETPSGQIAHVSLELRFSAFHGYGGPGAEAAGYLGLQCHGVLWPSPESELPHYWPIAPPIVSGKVRAPFLLLVLPEVLVSWCAATCRALQKRKRHAQHERAVQRV